MKVLITLPAPVADIVQQTRGEMSIQRFIVEAIKSYHQQRNVSKGREHDHSSTNTVPIN